MLAIATILVDHGFLPLGLYLPLEFRPCLSSPWTLSHLADPAMTRTLRFAIANQTALRQSLLESYREVLI